MRPMRAKKSSAAALRLLPAHVHLTAVVLRDFPAKKPQLNGACEICRLGATDADFNGTPLGWAIHGSEHGWYCRTGNYPATVEVPLQAGAKLEEKMVGSTEAVRQIQHHHPSKK